MEVCTHTYTCMHNGTYFIIADRAHPYFSKGAGNLIFSALVHLVVRSETSKFVDQNQITGAFGKFYVGSIWNYEYLPLNATST